ncbi:MAG TPA: response regulator, partial [Nitrospirota bacterium]
MIVSCDCGARLKVDKAKIAGRKAKVRCPRCRTVLPLPHASAGQPEAAPERAASPLPSPGPLILVAHDSEVVRCMVSDVLTGAGFCVETASDGVEALKKAVELRPDGLVLDVGLPGIYGFELCERLKGNPDTGNIKIVLLSSVYDMRRYKRTPVSLYGADDYVEKHHIPDFLPVKLRALISPGGRPGGTSPGAAVPQPFSLEASVFQKEE